MAMPPLSLVMPVATVMIRLVRDRACGCAKNPHCDRGAWIRLIITVSVVRTAIVGVAVVAVWHARLRARLAINLTIAGVAAAVRRLRRGATHSDAGRAENTYCRKCLTHEALPVGSY